MAEEVGGIVYEVGMDVEGLKKGTQRARDEFGRFVKSGTSATDTLNGVDNAAKKTGKTFGGLSGSVSGLKTQMTALAGAISVSLIIEWGKRFLEVADNMTQLQARIARLSTDAKTANETFSTLANIASTTGASLSDTTKLWETLTSSLKEAGATNAQVLNLTDTLQKIGRIGGSSTEEMANALRQFGQSIASGTIRAEEFNSILEQMPELARQIAAGLGISMGELRARMLDGKLTAEDALNAIQDRTSVVNAEFEKLPRTMDQAVGSLEVSFSKLVVAVNDATGASKTVVEIIDQLAKYIDFLGDKSTSTSDKILSLATVISKLNPGAWAQMGVDALFGDDDIEKQKQYNEQVERFVKASAEGYEQTKKQAEATKHLKIAQAPTKDKKGKGKGKSAEERQAESVAEKLEKLRQQTMLNATSTSELSREQAILNAQQSLGKAATQEQIKLAGEYAAKIWDQKNALKEQAEAEKEKQRVEKSYQGLRAIASPTTGIDSEYQQRMADLNAYAAAYPQKITEIEQTRAAIEEQYRQQRIEAMWQEWSQQNAATQAAAAAFDAFGQTAGNALTGIITGSMSVSDALRSIGSNILSSVINAFVQMGIQWAQSVIMGQAGMAAASAATIAQAAAISAAMAPAAAMTSLATAGTNSAPAMAGMSATVGLAKTLSIAGALKNGGPAQEGSMYRVGENNLPEIFQASNGHQYMIPGDSGRVISNKDLTGGSGGVVVYNNVINNSSAQVSSSARDNGDGSVTIETIVSDISENGPIGQAISRNYNTNRRATE
ncbi:phage tail tape measure protein [Salmonella enterica subsp. enterica]|nr:phage tail tape measure protein [Salmonella enterica subsp. enterica]